MSHGHQPDYYGDSAVVPAPELQRFRTFFNDSGADIATREAVLFDEGSTDEGLGRSILVAPISGGVGGNARRFAGVTLEPIPNQKFGKVCIGGLCYVEVDAALAALDRLTLGETTAGHLADVGDNESAVLTAVGVISNAALKTLNATPVTVIAAPAAGYYLQPIRAHYMLDHGGVDFDGAAAGEDLATYFTGQTDNLFAVVDHDGFGNAAADAHVFRNALDYDEGVVQSATGIDLTILVGEWYAAAGDSVLRYEFEYQIKSLACASVIPGIPRELGFALEAISATNTGQALCMIYPTM